MDFKQLEAYILIIELNSFSKAADTMDISQSSVSIYIKDLEKELDTKLITRSTRDISLTENGAIFYEYAKNIVTLKEKAIFSVKKNSNSYEGNINILASSVPAQYILPKLISSFSKKYRDISFNVIQSNSCQVVDAVTNGEYEFGIVGSKIENQKCCYKKITSSPLVLITPPSESYKINITKNFPKYFYENIFISREDGSATKMHYEKLIKSLSIKIKEMKPIAKFSSTHSIIQAVSSGLGISIVARAAAEDYIKSGMVYEVSLSEFNTSKKDIPHMDFHFVFKKDCIIHPRAKLFIDFVLKN